MTDDDKIILDSLKELGIRFWIKDGKLAFKYPDGLEGSGRKDLFKFIKNHEPGLLRILQK